MCRVLDSVGVYVFFCLLGLLYVINILACTYADLCTGF
jgi:hypothetical protein